MCTSEHAAIVIGYSFTPMFYNFFYSFGFGNRYSNDARDVI